MTPQPKWLHITSALDKTCLATLNHALENNAHVPCLISMRSSSSLEQQYAVSWPRGDGGWNDEGMMTEKKRKYIILLSHIYCHFSHSSSYFLSLHLSLSPPFFSSLCVTLATSVSSHSLSLSASLSHSLSLSLHVFSLFCLQSFHLSLYVTLPPFISSLSVSPSHCLILSHSVSLSPSASLSPSISLSLRPPAPPPKPKRLCGPHLAVEPLRWGDS